MSACLFFKNKGFRIFSGVMALFIILSFFAVLGLWGYSEFVVKPIANTLEDLREKIEIKTKTFPTTLFAHKKGLISCTIHGTEKCTKLVIVEHCFQHSCEYRKEGWLTGKYARMTIHYRAQAGINLESGAMTLLIHAPNGTPDSVEIEELAGRGELISCEQVGEIHLEYDEKILGKLTAQEVAGLANRVHHEARKRAMDDVKLKQKAEEYARDYLLQAVQGKTPTTFRLD